MSENLNLKTISTVDPSPFRHLCVTIGELPSAFVESMSYYELLAWFVNYLENTVIPAVNANGEATAELQELFVELHDYVHDYFDNLDVQEEINNKLDAMAASGVLSDIISQYLNSTAIFGFNSVNDMKAASNLINGSYAKTLGYYEKNDGGEGLYKIRNITNDDIVDEGKIIAMDDNNLVAELIIKNNEVNAKQYGAKGDGITDDTAKLQAALNSGYNVYLPSGTYITSSKLTMPFNIKVEGKSKVDTIIKSSVVNDFIMQYGTAYDYGKYKGIIKNIKFTSDNEVSNKPKGIMLYSGITISTCEFGHIGQAIDRVSNYIDLIKIEDCAFLYNVPNGNYIIDLTGNADALVLSHLKFESYTGDTTNYNGINISTCHGGSLNNSILNCNLTFDKCNAFSVNNLHTEGLDKIFSIKDSNISFNNVFKFKNEVDNDFVLSTTDYSKNNSVQLRNIVFTRNGSNLNKAASPEINELPTNTQLYIESCYELINLADVNEYSASSSGIKIQGDTDFNSLSGKYSCKSLVTDRGIFEFVQVNAHTSVSNFATIAKNSHYKWLAENASSVNYRAVVISDETRKVICSYSSNQSIDNLVQNGDCVSMALSSNYAKDLYLFRGSSSDNYTLRAKISAIERLRIYDDGIRVNGITWETVESTNGRTGYYNVTKYVNNGENVVVYASNTPSVGTWKKFDKVINTNITAGQVTEWIYDGENWVAQGTYAE